MSISAKIIADSISPNGVRITTFELEFHRYILPEFNTHRLFSRNAASSRAIPVNKAIKLIQENTAMPIHWGANQKGMQAKEELDEPINVKASFKSFVDPEYEGWDFATHEVDREIAWGFARNAAISIAESFNEAGYHKQIVNRLMEPFSHIKVVCTATEYENFFYLRRHEDAQPEIHELADKMWEARQSSNPTKLASGDWHLPYYKDGFWSPSGFDDLPDAIAVSASCCAQVSYRLLDDSLEKAKMIYDRLVHSKPVHASPFEHQARPVTQEDWENPEHGATHVDLEGNLWSGNFRGWIQNRQLIEGHVVKG